jgi:hypothetical protein
VWPIADDHAAVQMLVNSDGLAGQRIAPARFIELEDAIFENERVVVVDCAFVLHAEDSVQIFAPVALCGFPSEAILQTALRALRFI